MSKSEKVSKSVLKDLFDTFLTLYAGRSGKSFLKLFEDFGARRCGDSCLWGLQAQPYPRVYQSFFSLSLSGERHRKVLLLKATRQEHFSKLVVGASSQWRWTWEGHHNRKRKLTRSPPKQTLNLLEDFAGLRKATFQTGGRYKIAMKKQGNHMHPPYRAPGRLFPQLPVRSRGVAATHPSWTPVAIVLALSQVIWISETL